MLKTLHLEYMFLSPELRDFLVAKASNTLQQVHLRSCLAEIGERMTDDGSRTVADGLHWHELFDAVSSAQPENLRLFRISEEWPAPLPKEQSDFGKYQNKIEAEDDYRINEEINEEIKEAWETVQRGEKRVWAHVWVDHKYGMVFVHLKDNFFNFRAGRDQEAYERLIDIIGKNGGLEAKFVEERETTKVPMRRDHSFSKG